MILTGLIAGTFFYGGFCVLPTFYDVTPDVHLRFRTALMNHNKVVVMALVLMAVAVLIFYCWQVRKIKTVRVLCLLALVLTIISLVITRVASVPINMEIKTWLPASPPSGWLTTLKRWNLYNTIRTITSIGCFIILLTADWWLINKTSGTQ
jgi:uncharacterized membrane protein